MQRRTGKNSMGSFKARLATLAGAAALLVTVLTPAAASAEMPLPESVLGPEMNLTFVRDNARVVGDKALVFVKCNGPQSGFCSGTVTLSVAAADHKVPFSVAGGHRQTVVVPLGSDDAESIVGHRALAVASTVQPLGPCQESERLLRLR